MKHVAPLRYDVIFKKAFSIPEIFSAFVSDVFGTPIYFRQVEIDKRFLLPVAPIEPRFQLYAENEPQWYTEEPQPVIVALHHQHIPTMYERLLQYHWVILLEHRAKVKVYRLPARVVMIVVFTSGDHHKTDVATIDFSPKDRYGQALQDISHQVIYLCPPYANDETPPALRQWMEAIEDTLDSKVEEQVYPPTIQSMFDLIEQSDLTPEERAKMKDEHGMQELLHKSIIARQAAQKQAEEAQKRKEATLKQTEEERIAREAALKQAEEERIAREAALKQAEEAQEKIAQLRAQLQALQEGKS